MSTATATALAAAAPAPGDAGAPSRDRLLQALRALPPLPQAALEALAALRDERSGNDHCAELIARDQALSARTLRLANSAFYGVPGRVAAIRDAVHLLGRRTLASLVTVATVSAQFPAEAAAARPLLGFWRHALASALAARELARALRLDAETAFTAGLLHDIGRLLLATVAPAELAQADALARQRDEPLHGFEVALLGHDHVAVGALVARHWQFPAEVVDAIAGHHAPPVPADGAATLADVVHLADCVAHALDLASDPDEMVPPLDAGVLARAMRPAAEMLALFAATEAGVLALSETMGA